MKKKVITPKIKPSDAITKKLSAQKVGRMGMKPLTHKEDGTPLKDYEYFELLGRKVKELEEANPNPNLPVNFKDYGFDDTSVELARKVVEAIDDKRPISEIEQYVKNSINYDE